MDGRIILIIGLSVAASALALADAAVAQTPDDTCKSMPSREAYAACRAATGGTCDPQTKECTAPTECPWGGVRNDTPSPGPREPTPEEPREPTNCYGPARCPQEVQRERPAANRTESGESTGSCSEAACRQVTLYNVDPERGDDCHEVVCRNVPAVIETIKVPILVTLTDPAGLGGLLDETTETQLVKYRTVRIVKSAAFWCESGNGSGTGTTPTPCKKVVDTPVVDAGADPFAATDFNAAKANECSYVDSNVGGRTYVDDGDATYANPGTTDCGETFTLFAAFGAERERYHAAFAC